ncbi:SusC/RagA family TonB-linked outer membrane protein [Bacteroides ovatus]|nr:SusC/RagA family TonB-linked outer membrane protein [Bacteroides ovatus]
MKKIIILFICLTSSIWHVCAQTKVSGIVKDAQGMEMIGATVLQKGTNNGIVTGLDGKFTLTLSNKAEQTLLISMIGFIEQSIAIKKNHPFINITLEEDIAQLDEVVVVGYGTQKKVSLTGSISNVGTEDLKSMPVSSVTNALGGRIPGLVTRQESGRPGGDQATMFVRGRASLNDSSPLVLIDGVERPMAQIDPDDIETISVLKDASATAVYGVRGANGVILVTTRRGREGETRISFSSEFGVTSFNRISQTLSAESVSRFMREGAINDGFDPSDTGNTRGLFLSEYDNYLYRTQKSPFTHPDNDFVDMFTKNGLQQKYNVNLSGGNKTVRYFVSVGYFTQTGMFETDVDKIKEHETIQALLAASPDVAKGLYKEGYNSEYKYSRLTTRSNIDINLTEDFKVSVNLAYRFGSQNRPYGYDADGQEALRLFGMFYRNSPQAFPILNANGTYAAADGIWRQNPLVTLCYSGFFLNFNNKLETDFAFKYNLRKLLKGLSIDGKFSYDAGWSNNRSIQQRPNIYQYNPVNGTYKQGLEMVLPTKATNKTAATHRKYAEAAVRYKQSFSGHNISGLVLYNMSYTSTPGGRYSYVPHIYQALVGRVNYDYENRYLFEVNAGYNGSNRFAGRTPLSALSCSISGMGTD